MYSPSRSGMYVAASIFAKTTRDQQLDDLRDAFGALGSGYPSDPVTRQWLLEWARSQKPWPAFVRTLEAGRSGFMIVEEHLADEPEEPNDLWHAPDSSADGSRNGAVEANHWANSNPKILCAICVQPRPN